MAGKDYYSPLGIDMRVFPKSWFDTDPMTFEDALMEAEKLQNAELSNDINQQNLSKKKKDLEYEDEFSKGFGERMKAREDAGETEPMSPDEIFDYANEVGLKYGKGEEVADRELRRSEAEAKRKLAEDRTSQPKVMVRSPFSDLVKIDPDTGETTILREGKEKPTKSTGNYPKTLVNPETLDFARADDPESEAVAKGSGFTMELDSKISVKDYNDQKMLKGGSGKENFNFNPQPFKAPIVTPTPAPARKTPTPEQAAKILRRRGAKGG